ncbi:hypothetical protein SMC26_00635 [Actinomadura fulvescens]|uniref:Secreted protein n=1 Tax=Actinomadura fulvescens TaxID=46160 RepID=A0ABN3PR34_9ACTN
MSRRRLAAVTVASLTALSVTTISAVTSEANAAARRWTTKGSFTNIESGGTYAFYKDKKGRKRVRVDGWLRDRKKNGWAAGVQFEATRSGKARRSLVYFFSLKGKPADFDYKENKKYGLFFTSDHLSHLYVRECGVRPNKRETKKCGKWQKIY